MSDLIERISQRYHDDVAAARKVVSPTDLPYAYEAITPEWLTAILCADTPGAEVIGLTLGDPDDGYCNRRRIFIEYNGRGRQAGLPATVFCKACHDLTSRISFAVTGAGENEANFYNHIRDSLEIETTRAYFAHCDRETMNSIIVMHDERDAAFFEVDTEIDFATAHEMMSLLAQFHATFFRPTELALATKFFSNYSQLWARFVELGAETRCKAGALAACSLMPLEIASRAEYIWPATLASVSRHEQRPSTLMHADGHVKNWYRSGGGILGLHDWQSVTMGNGIRDISYILTTGLTVEKRRAWERDLLAEYAKALHRLGGPLLASGDIWEDYRRQIPTCLATWTFQFDQPRNETAVHSDLTKATYVKQMTQAMNDLDSLGALLG